MNTDVQSTGDINSILTRLSGGLKKGTSSIRGLGVFEENGRIFIFYQSAKALSTTFQIAVSDNSIDFERFTDKACVVNDTKNADIELCSDFYVSNAQTGYVMTYRSREKAKTRIRVATSPDLINWTFVFTLPERISHALICYDSAQQKPYQLYLGRKSIRFISVASLREMEDRKLYGSRLVSDDFGLEKNYAELGSSVLTEHETVIIYHQKHRERKYISYTAAAAAYSRLNPDEALRINENIWSTPKEWSKKGAYPIGVVAYDYQLLAYWHVPNEAIYVVRYPYPQLEHSRRIQKRPQLMRHEANPLISPKKDNHWESFTTFNPAALYVGGKVHLVYRAQGFDYVSVLGYASSSDGIHIDERHSKPIYSPSQSFEYTGAPNSYLTDTYRSGGSYGGVEDPRLTLIDKTVYMTYVAYDGWSPPRVALTSIGLDDFLANRWNWTRAVLISPPHIVNKNAVIFPEKVRGKYVIMHRVFPDILLDYVDSLEFDGSSWLEGHYKIPHRPHMWDSRKLGAGAPPIKTELGWLLIYQAVDDRDPGRYKIGAMILDATHPERVVYRCREPVLGPSEHYENNGFKPGVCYPCGAVVIDTTLYIYYGAADSHVAVATAPLKDFLYLLKTTGTPRLESAQMSKVELLHV